MRISEIYEQIVTQSGPYDFSFDITYVNCRRLKSQDPNLIEKRNIVEISLKVSEFCIKKLFKVCKPANNVI